MRTLLAIALLSAAAFGQQCKPAGDVDCGKLMGAKKPVESEAVKTCQHAYMCPGVAPVTVSKITPEEKKKLLAAESALLSAQQELTDTQNKIIRAHGGYVLPPCDSRNLPGGSCWLASGQRESDDVEWKGDYLILTKKWLSEL